MESSKTDFNTLRILFFSLLAGMMFFGLVVTYLLSIDESGPSYLLGPDSDLIAVGAYVLIMIGFSRFIDTMWKRQISTVLRVQRPAFTHYRTNVIIRLAILEGAGLLTIVFVLITNNPLLFVATALVLMALWLAKPTEEEFRERYDTTVTG